MKRIIKWSGILLLVLIGGLLALAWTPDTKVPEMKAKYASVDSQFIDLGDGLVVHARDEGVRGAPTFVLLHGSNDSLQTWDPWVAKLTLKYRVIRLDLPGHGLTGGEPKSDYSRERSAAVVDAVTRKMGAERFVLVGHSMGGGIALSYALAHPEKLSGLVLIDTAGGPPPVNASEPIAFKIARTPVLSEVMNVVTPRSMIETSLRQSVGKPEIVTAAMVDRYWELLRYPGNRMATSARFRVTLPPFTPEALASLKLPILIMWGDGDTIFPMANRDWFAGALLDEKVVTYSGVGHMPMQEASDLSVQDMVNWLEASK
jgi:pimeloyl-ACP methyl ester carboxylesterase